MIAKLKFLLSVFAMLASLLAASQIHAHETGMHDANQSCISCDVEDIAAHGSAPASSLIPQPRIVDNPLFFSVDYAYTAHAFFGAIRAPPLFS